MRITETQLRRVIRKEIHNSLRESLSGSKILRERPWSVLVRFRMAGGFASDSEGEAPDGFSVVMTGESGKTLKISVDTYWNPQAGDESGNSIKVHDERGEIAQTYVPTRFDDGRDQFLLISNSPTQGAVVISHSSRPQAVPIAYLVVQNPFENSDDLSFEIENLGNGNAVAKIVSHTNL